MHLANLLVVLTTCACLLTATLDPAAATPDPCRKDPDSCDDPPRDDPTVPPCYGIDLVLLCCQMNTNTANGLFPKCSRS